jgi:hypothetical protein
MFPTVTIVRTLNNYPDRMYIRLVDNYSRLCIIIYGSLATWIYHYAIMWCNCSLCSVNKLDDCVIAEHKKRCICFNNSSRSGESAFPDRLKALIGAADTVQVFLNKKPDTRVQVCCELSFLGLRSHCRMR